MHGGAGGFTIDEMDSQPLDECAECERARTVCPELGALDGPATDPGLVGQLVLGEAQLEPTFPESRSAGHRRQLSADFSARQLARAQFRAIGAGADFLAFYAMGGGTRIRRARTAAKMSQRKLCEVIDVAESTLRSWETDEHQAPMNMLAAIAKATGVRGDFLLGQTDEIVFVVSDRENAVEEATRNSLAGLAQPPPDTPPPPAPAPAQRPKRRQGQPPNSA